MSDNMSSDKLTSNATRHKTSALMCAKIMGAFCFCLLLRV